MRDTQLPNPGRVNRSLQLRREVAYVISSIQVSKRPDGKHPAADDLMAFFEAAAKAVEPFVIAAKVLAAPANTVAPRLNTNKAKVGQILTASNGQWSGEGVAFDYQWAADEADIPNAISNTYVPKAADVGKALTCKVRAYNEQGAATVATAATQVTVA